MKTGSPSETSLTSNEQGQPMSDEQRRRVFVEHLQAAISALDMRNAYGGPMSPDREILTTLVEYLSADSSTPETSPDARDAARYRFLRNPGNAIVYAKDRNAWGKNASGHVRWDTAEQLDAAVDAAMGSAVETKPEPTVEGLERLLQPEDSTPVYVWPDGYVHNTPPPEKASVHRCWECGEPAIVLVEGGAGVCAEHDTQNGSVKP